MYFNNAKIRWEFYKKNVRLTDERANIPEDCVSKILDRIPEEYSIVLKRNQGNNIRYIELDFLHFSEDSKYKQAILVEINTENKNDSIGQNSEVNFKDKGFHRLFFTGLIPKDKKEEIKLFHLDGESKRIHQINKDASPKDGKPIKMEKAEKYLDFFTTFLVSDNGPFLLIESEKELQYLTGEKTVTLFQHKEKERILDKFGEDHKLLKDDPKTIKPLIEGIKKLTDPGFIATLKDAKENKKRWNNFSRDFNQYRWNRFLDSYKRDDNKIDWKKLFLKSKTAEKKDDLFNQLGIWFNIDQESKDSKKEIKECFEALGKLIKDKTDLESITNKENQEEWNRFRDKKSEYYSNWINFPDEISTSDKNESEWADFFKTFKKEGQYYLYKLINKWYNLEKPDKKGKAYFVKLTQYGSNLFMAIYAVNINGSVVMLDDVQIDYAKSSRGLPIGQWKFQSLHKKSIMALKFVPFQLGAFETGMREASTPYPTITSQEYEETLNELNKTGRKGKNGGRSINWLNNIGTLTIENSYQEKSNWSNWKGQHIYRPIEFNDISFKGKIDLSNINADADITFRNCVFLELVSFKNAVIGGNLIFENCVFYGLTNDVDGELDEFEGENNMAVNLNGINIRGEMAFLRCDVYRSISAKRSTIGQIGMFRGVTMVPLYNLYYNEINASKDTIKYDKDLALGTELDIRHSHFGRGLDLSAYFYKEKEKKLDDKQVEKAIYTQIAGSIWAQNCRIGGAVYLSGLLVTRLKENVFTCDKVFTINRVQPYFSFSGSKINGGIYTWRPKDGANGTFHFSRTYIDNDFELNHCDIEGDIDLRGIWIGGNLTLNGINCRGDVHIRAFNQYDMDWSDRFMNDPLDAIKSNTVFQFNSSTLMDYRDKKGKQKYRLANFNRPHILEAVSFKGSHVKGVVNFEGAYIGGKISFQNGSFGALEFGISISPINCSNTGSKEAFDYLHTNEDNYFSRYLKDVTENMILIAPIENDNTKPDNFHGLLLIRPECSNLEINNADVTGKVNLEDLWILPHETDNVYGELRPHKELYTHCGNGIKALESQDLYDFAHSSTKKSEYAANVYIENSKIHGALQFYTPDFLDTLFHKITGDRYLKYKYRNLFTTHDKFKALKVAIEPFRKTFIYGNLSISNTEIGGCLDITGLVVTGENTYRDVIFKANITSDSCQKTELQCKYYYSNRLKIDVLSCDGNIKLSNMKLKCFKAENSSIRGKLDIQNMRLCNDKSKKYKAKFSLKYSEVRGSFYLEKSTIKNDLTIKYSKVIGHAKIVATEVGGSRIDLTASEFGKLTLPLKTTNKKEWILNRTRIKHFNVLLDSDELLDEKTQIGIDFRGIRFESITLNEDDVKKQSTSEEQKRFLFSTFRNKQQVPETKKIIKFLKLGNKQLKNANPETEKEHCTLEFEKRQQKDFSLEAYAEAEKIFRSQGRKQEADEIYTRMQRSLRKMGIIKGFRERFLHLVFFDGLSNFGSNSLRPLGIGIFLLVITFMFCCKSENWQEPDKVNFSFALREAINISIPILEIPAYNGEESVLREVREVNLWAIRNISPKAVVLILSLIGWIIWPVFLLSVVGLLKRN